MPHLLFTLVLAFAMMTALWPFSIVFKDVSIVDILWAPAFAILGWALAYVEGGADMRGWVCLALVSLWAMRLGTHILMRRLKSGKEDHRYTSIRRKYGNRFPVLSLVVIFWLQAVLLWLISLPLQAAISTHTALTYADIIGFFVIFAGIVIEGVADAQLTAFRAKPGGADSVLDTGVWRWSRHPNYFGDFLIWWGFFFVAVAGGAPWWTVAGPIVMTALLMHYSGAGLMEDTITKRRPAYQAYIESTSRFFPWPPARK